jgi:uncharacterized peroxidase-related enzyme
MPRLNVVAPAQATGKVKETYDSLQAKMGKVINIFQGMGNSAAALNAYLGMSKTLAEGELAPADREAIYLAASQYNNCTYCVAAHTLIAQRGGMSEDEVLAIRKFAPKNPKHQALVTFVKRVIDTKGFVQDADVAAVKKAGYTDGQIAETVGYIALATFSNFFNHVYDTPLDFPPVPKV